MVLQLQTGEAKRNQVGTTRGRKGEEKEDQIKLLTNAEDDKKMNISRPVKTFPPGDSKFCMHRPSERKKALFRHFFSKEAQKI
jgi:hypothetical protein